MYMYVSNGFELCFFSALFGVSSQSYIVVTFHIANAFVLLVDLIKLRAASPSGTIPSSTVVLTDSHLH